MNAPTVVPIPSTPGRRNLAGRAIQLLIASASRGLKPFLKSRLKGVSVTHDVEYLPTGRWEHLLDIYRPAESQGKKLPVVLYIHGGGFTIGSKESHWIFGAEFARAGYLTVLPNYRLSPENPFPAALEDVCAAWLWLLKHVEALGGDINRIVIAGESAGANLSLNVVLAAVAQGSEKYAQPIFHAGVVPKLMWLGCGFFEMSKIHENPKHSALVRNRIRGIVACYLGGVKIENQATWDLVDPLRVIESDRTFERPLPLAYLSCGGADPVLNHSEQMAAALLKRNPQTQYSVFPGAGHGFQAVVFLKQAQACWKETLEFLAKNV